MSFLTPLYALGLLAVSLPILFHLIQRRPKGQVDFSSTMFLSASPPRLTKRSRLENWPLLLLRATALILLALAFARPFVRSLAQLNAEPPGRQLLVLLDTSASMQREDLWRKARAEIDGILDNTQASDQIALATFDSGFESLISFEQMSGVPVSRRKALVDASLGNVSPTWAATDLGHALVAAADILHTASEEYNAEDGGNVREPSKSSSTAKLSQIILISDLQSGSDLAKLQGYQWPQDIHLDVRQVRVIRPGNASLVVLTSNDATTDGATTTDELRVRVHNTSDSTQQQFRLGWLDAEGRLVTDREYRVQVPPGATRTVGLPYGTYTTNQLMLQGDRHSFDNVVHVTAPVTMEKRLLYVGDRNDDPRSSLSYYLQRATLGSFRLVIDYQQQLPDEFLLAPDPTDVPLIVVGSALQPEGVNTLRSYLANGGRVLYVLHQPIRNSVESEHARMIGELTGAANVVLSEASVDDYSMFSTIDFRNNLFQPFADPRFNDFTKIHFWSHRHIETKDLATDERKILVRFDDQSPALIEQTFGEGRLWILMAGWHPMESQLALSTKFVPLLHGMFDPTRGRLVGRDNYVVGEKLELQKARSKNPTNAQIVYPDGTIEDVSDTSSLVAPDQPGVYQLVDGTRQSPFAVNMVTDESRTTPLDVSELEQYGVLTARALTAGEMKTAQRQMRDVELEGGQKLWRWLLLAALAILTIETLLGAWLSDRQVTGPLPGTT